MRTVEELSAEQIYEAKLRDEWESVAVLNQLPPLTSYGLVHTLDQIHSDLTAEVLLYERLERRSGPPVSVAKAIERIDRMRDATSAAFNGYALPIRPAETIDQFVSRCYQDDAREARGARKARMPTTAAGEQLDQPNQPESNPSDGLRKTRENERVASGLRALHHSVVETVDTRELESPDLAARLRPADRRKQFEWVLGATQEFWNQLRVEFDRAGSMAELLPEGKRRSEEANSFEAFVANAISRTRPAASYTQVRRVKADVLYAVRVLLDDAIEEARPPTRLIGESTPVDQFADGASARAAQSLDGETVSTLLALLGLLASAAVTRRVAWLHSRVVLGAVGKGNPEVGAPRVPAIQRWGQVELSLLAERAVPLRTQDPATDVDATLREAWRLSQQVLDRHFRWFWMPAAPGQKHLGNGIKLSALLHDSTQLPIRRLDPPLTVGEAAERALDFYKGLAMQMEVMWKPTSTGGTP